MDFFAVLMAIHGSSLAGIFMSANVLMARHFQRQRAAATGKTGAGRNSKPNPVSTTIRVVQRIGALGDFTLEQGKNIHYYLADIMLYAGAIYTFAILEPRQSMFYFLTKYYGSKGK